MAYQGAGGFIANPLLSPAPSQASSTAAPTDTTVLPIARAHPLQPGSQKELIFINHVDSSILNINRRYAKKFTGEVEEGVGRGYDNFIDVVRDLRAVFDVVWTSGTPSLQVPYLLSLASLLCSYLPAFPFAPNPTFQMVEKLDAAFSGLLQGPPISIATTANRQRKVSLTDQVRIRSVTELTRVTVVDKISSHHGSNMHSDAGEPDESTADEEEGDVDGDFQKRNDLLQSASQLYVNTLDLLGDSLISDDREMD